MAWTAFIRPLPSEHYRPYLEITATDPFPATPPRSCRCLCLLDTGSDVSALPESVIEGLPLVETGRAVDIRPFGLTGLPVKMNTYYAILTVWGREFPVRVVKRSGNKGLIGRDVLNGLFVMFDGPKRRIAVLSGLSSSFGRVLGWLSRIR